MIQSRKIKEEIGFNFFLFLWENPFYSYLEIKRFAYAVKLFGNCTFHIVRDLVVVIICRLQILLGVDIIYSVRNQILPILDFFRGGQETRTELNQTDPTEPKPI